MDLNHQGPQPPMTLATKDLNLQGPLSPTSNSPPSNFLGQFPQFLYFFLSLFFNMIILFQLFLHVLEWTSTQYGISETIMDLNIKDRNHQWP